jgi:hypothetical protein
LRYRTLAANCDPGSAYPTIHPLNGKMKLTWVDAGLTIVATAMIRKVAYDPVPGPDVVLMTGTFVPPSASYPLGATISGEFFFDPILKALSNNDATALAQGAQLGQVLKNQYFFDNSQLANPCSAGGRAVAREWVGDGPSLIGSLAPGISW